MTEPELLPGDLPMWNADAGRLRIRFLGRAARPAEAPRDAAEAVRQLAPQGTQLAWARQIHSAEVLGAQPGVSGEGDALLTGRPRLALAIATADCVPIAVASGGGEGLAAIHAGWRGIQKGVVPAAIERLRKLANGSLTAWVGPAIGPCCYEVGKDVAQAVAEVSEPAVVVAGSGPAPHLDLRAAVSAQLRASGVETLYHFDLCTRCHPDLLWSYRRDGKSAGRNRLLAWIEPATDPAA